MTANLDTWFQWPSSSDALPTAREEQILAEIAALRSGGKAEDALIRTLAFHPSRHESLPCLLAVCENSIAAGRYSTAQNAAALILLHHCFVGGWCIAAHAQFMAGEISDAIDFCDIAITRHPESPLPYLILAQIYAAENPELAFHMFKQAVELFQSQVQGAHGERTRAASAVVQEMMTFRWLAPIKDRIAAFHFLYFDQPQN